MTQSDMQTFGLSEVHHCYSRIFFTEMRHPGAANCSCPKFDEGRSCVPNSMVEAWFAYIGHQVAQQEET